MKLESKIVNEVLEERLIEKPFEGLASSFNSKLKSFDPVNNYIELKTYFASGNGKATVIKNLLSGGLVKEGDLYIKNKGQKDFKGLYIFIHKKRPFYVGISRNVIQRMLNHLRGKTHFTSTLAYNIGLIKYKNDCGREYQGARKGLCIKEFVEPAKEFLLEQKLAFLPIKNDEELYLFEVYCAMAFKTNLNRFRTH